jgi:GAF domain-containing protein
MVGAFIIIFLKYLNLVQFKRTSELLSEIEEENKRAQEKEQELTKTLSDLEVAQKEESKRNWKTSGLAEIGNLLRVEDDLDELCDKIIAYIVKYMEASQGALFLLDDDTTKDRQEQELYIKSAYAYERKKRLDHRVQAGEGLIGQCFLEKDYIYLTEVPDSFISIKSGLGDANPRSILITPMIVNEQVYGIFEIASFKEIEQYQIDFMMELGENIAMTLNNFKVNERTKKLLEETQEQSEQLRSQEEEMRQNMEELQATQEEQERQQKEMAEKIKELEREKAQALSRLAELETD